MEIQIRVGVFGLNLRLAPLILATINMFWFWTSRALIGSVYTSAGYIKNRSVLGVMSRRKYHSSYSGDDVKYDTELVLLSTAVIRMIWLGHVHPIIETSYQRSDMWFILGRHNSNPKPSMWHLILDRNTQYYVYYAWYRLHIPLRIFLENWVGTVLY